MAKAERMSIEAETLAADMQRSYDAQTRATFSPGHEPSKRQALAALRAKKRELDAEIRRIATWRKLGE